jgi:hypothetical protein
VLPSLDNLEFSRTRDLPENPEKSPHNSKDFAFGKNDSADRATDGISPSLDAKNERSQP